jgi:hypothetical protein
VDWALANDVDPKAMTKNQRAFLRQEIMAGSMTQSTARAAGFCSGDL